MTASEAVLAPDVERVTSQSLAWPARARQLVITDPDTYETAAITLKDIKALRAEVDATFDPIVKAAHLAHRTACDQKKRAEAPLLEAETVIKGAMVRWDDEQARIARARQREAEEAERRRIEEDRITLAAHMESEGKAFGDDALVAEAEELINQPIVPIVPVVPKATPVVSGQHFSVTWSASVVNLLELVTFVAKNPQFLGLLSANQTALNGQARSLKEHLAIPGVKAIPTKTVVSRRA
jgi:hypothetical protein